jgi:hypothetical protein
VSAGLPGAGLAGLFFILSALLAVPIEAVRTVRGRGSRASWLRVTRHAALALAMIAALQLFFLALSVAIERFFGKSPLPKSLPVAPVLMTLSVLVVVLSAAKVLELVLRWRSGLRDRPQPVLVPSRASSPADL